MTDDKTTKIMLVLAVAGAAAVGIAYALKKKPPEEFDTQIGEMIES